MLAVAAAAGAAVAVPAAAVAATAVTAAPSSAAPTAVAAAATAARAGVASPARSERLRRLAVATRVVGEGRADPAALAVDLDHALVDLRAALEHVLDRVRPLAGLHVRDAQQPVGALRHLDERAERRGL